MPSLQCPLAGGYGPSHTKARDTSPHFVNDAACRVGIAPNGLREESPPCTGRETREVTKKSDPREVSGCIHMDLVNIDVGESTRGDHASIMTKMPASPIVCGKVTEGRQSGLLSGG
jgi:hypothetical protein